MNKPKLQSLTGMRFFAALAVVLRHFGGPMMTSAPFALRRLGEQGFVAVSFFFVLSGFVLTYSYYSAAHQLRSNRSRFYLARFARIYPAYALALILAIPRFWAAIRPVHTLGGTVARVLVGGAIVSTLMQSWIPWMANYINSPAWSLSVEAFFYLTFPLILPVISRLSKTQAILLAAVAWLIVILPGTLYAYGTGVMALAEDHTLWSTVIQCTPLFRIGEFVIGCLAAHLFLISGCNRKLCSVAFGCSTACALLILASCRIPELVLGNGLLAPLFAVIIASSAGARDIFSKTLGSPFLVLLGEASYGIYILQEPIARWFVYVFHKEPASSAIEYTALLVICSVASLYAVERPLQRLIVRRPAKITALRDSVQLSPAVG